MTNTSPKEKSRQDLRNFYGVKDRKIIRSGLRIFSAWKSRPNAWSPTPSHVVMTFTSCNISMASAVFKPQTLDFEASTLQRDHLLDIWYFQNIPIDNNGTRIKWEVQNMKSKENQSVNLAYLDCQFPKLIKTWINSLLEDHLKYCLYVEVCYFYKGLSEYLFHCVLEQ